MTPQAFIAHWQHNKITERAGAQQHFNDLCDLLDQEKPRDAENYTFERGAKILGGQGWADVWKRGCFAWEYKAPGKDLNAALKQLMNYALALDNPPLLVVSDLRTIEIHTHFTGHPSEVHVIKIEDLTKPEVRQKLTWLFQDPERFKPQITTYGVTETAATRIGEIAVRLNNRGNHPEMVAHFLIQCVFCMFAEDAKLLPEKLFETVMDKSNPDGSKAKARLTGLFTAMQAGGDFAMNDIPWFNGGLFKVVNVPNLETSDVVDLLDAARMDWSQIEPAILGTLFERGLNPDMRSQLGAHYTDPATIMKIIKPVIEQPLLTEWQVVKEKIAKLSPLMKFIGSAKSSKPNKEMAEGYQLFRDYLKRLQSFRVLDPACGSGNFLYLSLKTLKDIEHRVNLEVEALGLHREINIEVSPLNVMGIELNPYAAELARVTVWIGEIQWMLTHGYQYRKNPILASLDHIENRDALLNEDGSEAEWPECDAIVGNPPFLGNKKMLAELGEDYTGILRLIYKGRVPEGAELVTYWFEKARYQLEHEQTKYSGLVATNSIRGGDNLKVLKNIVEKFPIFNAWSDEPWVNAGAAVRVSLVAFGKSDAEIYLDGLNVSIINADLSAETDLNLTLAQVIKSNKKLSFQGSVKIGSFNITGDIAREWLKMPNPHNQPNSQVLRRLRNAKDITSRNRDEWIVDFAKLTQQEANLFETPFEYVKTHIKPIREMNPDKSRRENWWLHGRTGDDLRAAVSGLDRVIVTPRVSKYRLFVWMSPKVYCDDATVTIASSSDITFGILSSRFHEAWSLATCTWMGVGNDPRYTPKTCFETYPFPEGLSPKKVELSATDAISLASIALNSLRENWLNPTGWVDWVISSEEENAGYSKRPVAKLGHEEELKKRTLTNLYNARPTWLDNAHKALDKAVADAYGWSDYTPEMTDDEILRRLLALNLARSNAI